MTGGQAVSTDRYWERRPPRIRQTAAATMSTRRSAACSGALPRWVSVSVVTVFCPALILMTETPRSSAKLIARARSNCETGRNAWSAVLRKNSGRTSPEQPGGYPADQLAGTENHAANPGRVRVGTAAVGRYHRLQKVDRSVAQNRMRQIRQPVDNPDGDRTRSGPRLSKGAAYAGRPISLRLYINIYASIAGILSNGLVLAAVSPSPGIQEKDYMYG